LNPEHTESSNWM